MTFTLLSYFGITIYIYILKDIWVVHKKYTCKKKKKNYITFTHGLQTILNSGMASQSDTVGTFQNFLKQQILKYILFLAKMSKKTDWQKHSWEGIAILAVNVMLQ